MTTVDECLAALREAARRLGESPSKAQYEEFGLIPASATIIRTCGGWNAAKEQADLETTASTGSRVGSKPDCLNFSDEEWAAMSVDQRWHYRHPEKNAQRSLDRRQRLREWLDIHAGSLGCRECDADDPSVLDFHHVRGKKEAEITDMVSDGYGIEGIHAELEKCDVLCANCHAKAHVSPPEMDAATCRRLYHDVSRGTFRPDDTSLGKESYLRRWTRIYKTWRGCRDCPERDGRCLQFHHEEPRQKVGAVSQLIADSKPTPVVSREIERCVVLCANCHRRTHQ